MSGGSMDYLYARLEDTPFSENTAERRAFAKHLALVAKALHDIEWVDSCDYAKGDENAAIMACIGLGAVVEAAVEHAKRAKEDLEAAIERTHNKAFLK